MKISFLKYIILPLIIYIPIFSHLGSMPIQIWDESRNAISAYEMAKSGELIVTKFGYEPDMWNTKPPMLIWLQAICIKIFGLNEIAIRLPSALAGLFICFSLFYFSFRFFKKFWLSFIMVMILITTYGFYDTHSVRTGDYDALLTLFITLSSLFIFSFIETKKTYFLHLFFFFLSLAVLTKSIAGLFFIPAICIYIIYQKEMLMFLKNKHFYIGISYFLIICLGYYFWREFKNNGYLEAVWNNDLGGRFNTVLGGHQHGFWFYFYNFIDSKYRFWYIFVPMGAILGLTFKNRKINRITIFSLLIIISYFLIISTAQTKLEWYDFPMYPFLAILVSISVWVLFKYIKDIKWFSNNFKYNYLPQLFLFIIFLTPYRSVINNTFFASIKSNEQDFYEITYFLRNASKGKYDLNNHSLIYQGYNAHNLFYLKVLNEQGVEISFDEIANLSDGQKIVVGQKDVKDILLKNYEVNIDFESDNVLLGTIINQKMNPSYD